MEGRFLFLYVFLAKMEVSRLVDSLCHVMFAPMVGIVPLFLLHGIATLGWNLLPGFVPLLLSLVRSVLFVLHFLTAIFLFVFFVCNLS